MNALQKTENRLPDKAWRWRDRTGKMWNPKDMETRHLFHVVRMIWDHSMPEEAQTSFRNRYTFPSFYTKEYMLTAIRVCLPMLLHRRDYEPYMRWELERMSDYLKSKHPSIPAPLLQIEWGGIDAPVQ